MPSRGPGGHTDTLQVRIVRRAIPLLALAGALAVGAVFVAGLDPGDGVEHLGDEASVVAAVRDRPRRVCLDEQLPCAWLTLVDGRLVAFNTNGPLPDEYGRLGVAWCPSSRWFGSNVTGSRYDQRGDAVDGPAPRGLDRFGLLRAADGTVAVDFFSLTAGRQRRFATDTVPAAGPDCDPIPFDREADLVR